MPLSRRAQTGLAAGIAAGALVVAGLVALSGPSRVPDTLARGDAWLDELRAPTRLVAHRLTRRAKVGDRPVEGWASAVSREFTPDSPEGKALAALFHKGHFSAASVPDLGCGFQADFGLDFISRAGKRTATFSFGCGQVQGDSGIKGYQREEVAAFAAQLFPDDEVFQRVARGEPAHPPAH